MRRFVFASFSLLTPLACSGAIGHSESPEPTGPVTQTPGNGQPAGSPVAPAAQPGMPTTPTSGPEDPTSCVGRLAPAPMRRMTITEYNNTIADLLADKGRPADSFLPESKIDGFTNNEGTQRVTPVIAQQYLGAAERLADKALARLPVLLGCDPAAAAGEESCAKSFINSFGKRAYRRPLAADEQAVLLKVFRTARNGDDFPTAIKYVLQALLMAPQFLYRIELAPPAAGQPVANLDGWEVASRLSYVFWGSMPDDALFAAAESGKLTRKEEVVTQAKRLLASDRAKEPVATFFREWLGLDDFDHMEKDKKVFTTYSSSWNGLMKREADAFLNHVFWQENGALQLLFTAPYSFRNAALAKVYGETMPATGEDFVKVATDPLRRGGLMMQAGFGAITSPPDGTNPVKRGKFVREMLLCDEVPPPPPDVDATPPKNDPRKPTTTRERFIQHSQAPLCASCHKLMDPIGLAFENYDGVGKWRDTENGKPIDVSGALTGTDRDGPFMGVSGLAERLGQADKFRSCVVTNYFRYAFGRTDTEADTCALKDLQARLAVAKYNLKDFLLELVQSDSFLQRGITQPGGQR